MAFGADEFRPATPDELSMKEASWAPGAPAVVLDWDVRYDDTTSRSSEYIRIKVLRDEGRKYGDVELVAIRDFLTVGDIRARTTRPDGTVIPFNGKVYDKVIFKKGGLRVTSKTFTMPNVEPGAILEYRFSTTWHVSQYRTEYWPLQREIPVRRASFWIRPAQMLPTICVTRGMPKGAVPKWLKDHYEFQLGAMPPFVEEALAPPPEAIKPRIEFFYTRESDEKYWEAVGEEFSTYVEQFIGSHKNVKKAAQELTIQATTDDAKLSALYAGVQGLRNLSREVEKSEQEEKREKLRNRNDAGDVLRLGYGTAAELNRLFVGLARAAGFESWIALVSSRDETVFSRRLPDASQFSDEIAVVQVGADERYYDPALPYTRPGQLAWANTAVEAFVLKPKSKSSWGRTPEFPYATSVTSRVAELVLDGSVLKGRVTITYRGHDALEHRLEARNEDEAANRKRFEDAAKALFPEASITKLVEMSGLHDALEPLEIQFDVEFSSIGATTETRAILPLSLFSLRQKPSIAPETRRSPIFFPYQHQIEDRITLRLPTGFVVESLPKAATADAGIATFTSQWKHEEEMVRFERKWTVKGLAVPASEYPRIREFFASVSAADQDALVLKKDGV